jgi:uncharacterized protein (DUF58 family)
MLVVDTSGSMAFGSGPITKIDYAKRIAAGLAYLAIQQRPAAPRKISVRSVRQLIERENLVSC